MQHVTCMYNDFAIVHNFYIWFWKAIYSQLDRSCMWKVIVCCKNSTFWSLLISVFHFCYLVTTSTSYWLATIRLQVFLVWFIGHLGELNLIHCLIENDTDTGSFEWHPCIAWVQVAFNMILIKIHATRIRFLLSLLDVPICSSHHIIAYTCTILSNTPSVPKYR